MTTEALASHGTFVQLGDGELEESFTTIAEVKDITMPDFGNEFEEVTVHTTPGRARAYKAILAKDKTVEFDLNYVPGDPTHDALTGLKALADSGEVANFRTVLTDDAETTWQFAAFVETFGPIAAPVAGVYTAPVVLRLDGEVEDVTGS
jgi:hypothetical protein